MKLSEKTERTIGTSVSMIEVAKPQAKKSVVTETRAGRLVRPLDEDSGEAVLIRVSRLVPPAEDGPPGIVSAEVPGLISQCSKKR
ncbi:hypothetical protein RGI145_08160 [Roseomonas gilardii]|uniref:Uncharacterized protein n=1 Tax=Roseomonas gilardii TaxID=257708 RepID=A0A1L7AE76_9PROT|nr:hypothetical protein RGI145_08160 [Roseomonas gilardii]